jgi:hypothetical protein
MRRHPVTVCTGLALLVFTLVLAVSMTTTASAQAQATATSPSGSKVTASASAQVKVDKGAEEPTPFNLLEEASEEMFLSLLGWSSKYRIGLDVEDGDWVKYESLGEDPKETLEIRASKTEKGETWLVETRTVEGSGKSTELHALFSPGKPKLLQAYRVDENGVREDLTPLDDIRAGELFLEARDRAADALGGDVSEFRVSAAGDVQTLVGPFGEMLCRNVEVQVAEDVDPISFATRRLWLPEGTLLWLSEDVPRLMPMSAVLLPSLLNPDEMMAVPGGLVRSPYHVLVDYRGHE